MGIFGRLLKAAGLLIVLGAGQAQASGLRLTPLRLDLSADHNADQIELSNLGGAPMAVQVKAFRWTQQDGRDIYEPTKDIFFAPPIVTVPAQSRALVRFRLRGSAPKQQEGTYRIYFQEIPPAERTVASTGMTFRLRFGIPLFVRSVQAAKPALAVRGARAGDSLNFTLENSGGAHLKIQGVELFPADVDKKQPESPLAKVTHSRLGANYLLPGSRHEWELKLPPGADPGALQLLIRTDDYTGTAAKGITPQGWLWLPLAALKQ